MGRCKIIAEVGVNHNGDINLAIELIDRAVYCGADYVKFQCFSSSALVTPHARKAPYQEKGNGQNESQFEMLSRLELTEKNHLQIVQHCKARNIEYLASAFNERAIDFLSKQLGQKKLKIGSGELTNGPLLLKAARSGMEIFLSTGMSFLSEVEEAISVIAFGMTQQREPQSRDDLKSILTMPSARDLIKKKLTLLHCTSEYPAPIEDINLLAMKTMKDAFGVRVGYSDHARGNAMSIAAVAHGATLIEKHLTLDRNMHGPDHAASIEPEEFLTLVQDIRAVEKGIGCGIKQPSEVELINSKIVRKRIVSCKKLNAGDKITRNDITTKRSSKGICSMNYWDIIGRIIKNSIDADTPITNEDLI